MAKRRPNPLLVAAEAASPRRQWSRIDGDEETVRLVVDALEAMAAGRSDASVAALARELARHTGTKPGAAAAWIRYRHADLVERVRDRRRR